MGGEPGAQASPGRTAAVRSVPSPVPRGLFLASFLLFVPPPPQSFCLRGSRHHIGLNLFGADCARRRVSSLQPHGQVPWKRALSSALRRRRRWLLSQWSKEL